MNKFLSACLIAALSGCSDYAPTLQNYDPVTQGYKREGDFFNKGEDELRKLLENKRVGVFIGTFDPPHLEHMKAATMALDEGKLDYVVVIPTWPGTWDPAYKQNKNSTQIRIDLLHNACLDQKDPRIITTGLAPQELQNILMKDGKNQKVESKFKGTKFVGIVGSDTALWLAAKDKNQWYGLARTHYMKGIKIPQQRYNTAPAVDMLFPVDTFLIVKRPGKDFNDASLLGRKTQILNTPTTGLSSTAYRKNLQAQETDKAQSIVGERVQKAVDYYLKNTRDFNDGQGPVKLNY